MRLSVCLSLTGRRDKKARRVSKHRLADDRGLLDGPDLPHRPLDRRSRSAAMDELCSRLPCWQNRFDNKALAERIK
jgi:hypothetical protein